MVRARPGFVLLVDKPVGPTSHDVVARARKALGTGKVGHTGTLDPFASGLLLLCVDAATRLSEYLTALEKTYVATARLGSRTDTLDREGEVVASSDAWTSLDEEEIRRALKAFRGKQGQVPPQFSAKKVGGEAMYEKARRGQRVELEPVEVEVHEVELLEVALPEVRFRIRCSSGTYVRAVARDLGEALGVHAHLRALRRVRIGPFSVEGAVSVDGLGDETRVREAAVSPARALAHLPRIAVETDAARRLASGQAITAGEGETDVQGPLALTLDDVLVAVGELEKGRIRPRKVFVHA